MSNRYKNLDRFWHKSYSDAGEEQQAFVGVVEDVHGLNKAEALEVSASVQDSVARHTIPQDIYSKLAVVTAVVEDIDITDLHWGDTGVIFGDGHLYGGKQAATCVIDVGDKTLQQLSAITPIPFNSETVLLPYTDYVYNPYNNKLYIKQQDLFTGKFNIITNEDNKPTVVLFLNNPIFSSDGLDAILPSYHGKDDQGDREFGNIIWDAMQKGGLTENELNRTLSMITDVDYVDCEDGTVVKEIFTENNRICVMTDSGKVYSAPSGTTVKVSVGDTLEKGMNIFDTYSVYQCGTGKELPVDIKTIPVPSFGELESDILFMNERTPAPVMTAAHINPDEEGIPDDAIVHRDAFEHTGSEHGIMGGYLCKFSPPSIIATPADLKHFLKTLNESVIHKHEASLIDAIKRGNDGILPAEVNMAQLVAGDVLSPGVVIVKIKTPEHRTLDIGKAMLTIQELANAEAAILGYAETTMSDSMNCLPTLEECTVFEAALNDDNIPVAMIEEQNVNGNS